MSDKVETFQTFEIFDDSDFCYRVKDYNIEFGSKTGVAIEYHEKRDGKMTLKSFITMNYETASAIAQAIRKITDNAPTF